MMTRISLSFDGEDNDQNNEEDDDEDDVGENSDRLASFPSNQVVPYSAHTWYHIEFKNIRFDSDRFDYYVDGQLVQKDIPFRIATGDVDRLDLYSFQSGSVAWWDEIH